MRCPGIRLAKILVALDASRISDILWPKGRRRILLSLSGALNSARHTEKKPKADLFRHRQALCGVAHIEISQPNFTFPFIMLD